MNFAGPVALVYGLIRPVIWACLLYVIVHSRYLSKPCKPMLLIATVGFIFTSTASAFELADYEIGVFGSLANIAATPLLGIFVAGWAIAAAKFEGFRGHR